VIRGRKYVKSDAIVYEPGFTAVSGGAVVHGFYAGDNPPRVLTLDLTFDTNPQDVRFMKFFSLLCSHFDCLLT